MESNLSMNQKIKNILLSTIGTKETEETLAVANKIKEYIKESIVIEVGAGHGALGYVLAVLVPEVKKVIQVDLIVPKAFVKVKEKFNVVFPWTKEIVHRYQEDFNSFNMKKYKGNSFIVGCHPCKQLCDLIIDKAMSSQNSFTVVPCCSNPDLIYGQWQQLRNKFTRNQTEFIIRFYKICNNPNYIVKLKTIKSHITPKNDVIIGLYNKFI